jgi:hypothetical protein
MEQENCRIYDRSPLKSSATVVLAHGIDVREYAEKRRRPSDTRAPSEAVGRAEDDVPVAPDRP